MAMGETKSYLQLKIISRVFRRREKEIGKHSPSFLHSSDYETEKTHFMRSFYEPKERKNSHKIEFSFSFASNEESGARANVCNFILYRVEGVEKKKYEN